LGKKSGNNYFRIGVDSVTSNGVSMADKQTNVKCTHCGSTDGCSFVSVVTSTKKMLEMGTLDVKTDSVSKLTTFKCNACGELFQISTPLNSQP